MTTQALEPADAGATREEQIAKIAAITGQPEEQIKQQIAKMAAMSGKPEDEILKKMVEVAAQVAAAQQMPDPLEDLVETTYSDTLTLREMFKAKQQAKITGVPALQQQVPAVPSGSGDIRIDPSDFDDFKAVVAAEAGTIAAIKAARSDRREEVVFTQQQALEQMLQMEKLPDDPWPFGFSDKTPVGKALTQTPAAKRLGNGKPFEPTGL